MKKAHVAVRALAAILVAALLAGCPEPEAVVFTETQYERYVEHYDAETGALESWVYDSDDSLAEYTDFVYDENGFNTELWVYNSDQVMDGTTLVSRILYDYDESGNVTHAELWSTVGGVLTKYATYDATYNAQGNYLDYVERDGDDAVIEHRVCTYDGTGDDYLTETYYSDAGTANKVEEYRCTYDSVDASTLIREDHYVVIGAESSDATNDDSDYTRTMVYTYNYASRSLTGRDSGLSASGVRKPQTSHHRVD